MQHARTILNQINQVTGKPENPKIIGRPKSVLPYPNEIGERLRRKDQNQTLDPSDYIYNGKAFEAIKPSSPGSK